jgi:ribosomal protein L37E
MALVCPGCGRTTDDLQGRFCEACGMPLTPEGEAPALSEEQERARKIHPAYAEGELVKVAWASNQPEAELIAGLLLEEGIPSVVRRARGFDVPDFLAAGPRDVLVAAGGAEAAREALGGRGEPAQATVTPSLRGVALAMLIIAGASVVIAVIAAVLV